MSVAAHIVHAPADVLDGMTKRVANVPNTICGAMKWVGGDVGSMSDAMSRAPERVSDDVTYSGLRGYGGHNAE